jgi:hypothetical protein
MLLLSKAVKKYIIVLYHDKDGKVRPPPRLLRLRLAAADQRAAVAPPRPAARRTWAA